MNRFHRKTIYEALGREPVHPFPARMAPGIALDVIGEMEESVVLDPMMGSGTVLAMAGAYGHRGIGFDIDPLAVLISKVWTTPLDPRIVRGEAESVLENARQNFKNLAVADAYPVKADEETGRFIRYWFDPYARRQLAALSMTLQGVKHIVTRNALWCAFSRLIISKQSGASRAMDLSHSRPHRAFDFAPKKPFNKFLSAVELIIANSINKNSDNIGPQPTIKMGDARQLPLEDGSVDLVLTSPPYLNAIDYLRCSKFSLVWMGYSMADLRQIRAESVGTEATDDSLNEDRVVWGIIDALKLRPKLERRFERILARYIHDMRSAVTEVGRVLAGAGRAVYVIGENTLRGTYIRTSVVVTKLAELAGLYMKERRHRTLPANRRYMPPPSTANGAMDKRMRREVVFSFAKA